MKIGIALGSGAARGLAHIGLLKAFEDRKIKPYAITGSSMGALIGGIYASGYPIEKIAEFYLTLDFSIFKKFVDFKISSAGLLGGERIEEFIASIIGNKSFEDLEIKFKCVATDLLTGLEIIFDKGDLVKAIRASISFPAVFVPVYYDKMFLVDGGIKNPVPVDILPDECDIKFAVHVGPSVIKDPLVKKYYAENSIKIEKDQNSITEKFYSFISSYLKNVIIDDSVKYPNMLETIIQTISILQENAYISKIKEVKGSIVEIKPELSNYKLTDFTKAKEIINIGYAEGIKIIKEYLS
jgi:NTE family protein